MRPADLIDIQKNNVAQEYGLDASTGHWRSLS